MIFTKEELYKLIMGNGSWHTNEIEGKLPSIMMTDGPHGLRKETLSTPGNISESVPATCFPTESALACSWNPELIKTMGSALAEEAKANSVNIVLGCGVNIKRSPLCGRNFEYFSEDPFLAGTLAANYIKGVQSKGVGTSLKHFCANNQESNRMTSNSQIDERALREIYLSPFEMAVKKSQPSTIMASYNYVNGVHASENKELLTDILRTEWGFKGAVISDWGACISPEKSIPAGLDLEMPESANHKNIPIPEKALVNAGGRIASLALKVSKNTTKMTNSTNELLQKNHELAVELECESAVLLKNDGILPLKNKSQKIIIVGSLAEHIRYQGGGSSHINATHTPNAVDSLMQAGYSVTYLPGYNSLTDKVDIKLEHEIISNVSSLTKNNSDIPVLFFGGLPDSFEGEGYDRTTMEIPQNQISLLNKIYAINKNIILVNISGAPVEMPFVEKTRAILHMYLGGQGVDEAVAKIISGDVNPSGKLAETFPLKLSDTPCFNYFGKGYDIEYRESLFVGYRFYSSYKRPVLFPFGHGLSYTTFQYSDGTIWHEGIQTTSIDGKSSHTPKVSFMMKNIGKVEGKEVAQVYIKNPKGNFLRSEIELVGFQKIELDSEEEKLVTIPLSEKAYKIWDEVKHDFIPVPGEYELLIGSSVSDIRITLKFNVSAPEYNRDDRELLKEFFNQKEGGSDISLDISREQFRVLYGKDLSDFNNIKRGEFSKYNSLEQLSKKSFLAKIFLKISLKIASNSINKNHKNKNDPNMKMVIQMVKEAPVETIVNFSGGKFEQRFVNMIIKSANKK